MTGSFSGIEWTVWKVVGWMGNVVFSSRFFVQWYATEKRKQVVVPIDILVVEPGRVAFIFAYALFYKKDSVFIFAYAFTWIPYIRNLVIHHRHERARRWCPDCGAVLPGAANYCGQCGARLCSRSWLERREGFSVARSSKERLENWANGCNTAECMTKTLTIDCPRDLPVNSRPGPRRPRPAQVRCCAGPPPSTCIRKSPGAA